jgi:4a-hydroxytetrahydrobiopterin dehydratase
MFMTMSLAEKSCIPCRGGVPPMEPAKVHEMLGQLEKGWRTTHEDRRLERSFSFNGFAPALAFANKVGEIAEKEAHHPDLHVRWGSCTVEIWTHKIDGLTESDFILAAKVDRAYDGSSSSR